MSTTILLVRHGETDWNVERRVQGHTDRPLNATGLAQAHALAHELADESLDAVYASDLSRAHETARIVAEQKGLDVTVLPDLREKHFGSWEGLTDNEVLARIPHVAEDGPWGDGETSEELAVRVLDALRRIAHTHPEGRVLVISHGGPLRAVLRHCGRQSDTIANCHVVAVEIEDGELRPVD